MRDRQSLSALDSGSTHAVKQAAPGNATTVASADALDVSVKTVLEVIGLADLDEEIGVSSQWETCTCEGSFCNAATKKGTFAITTLWSLFILIRLF